MGQVRKIKAGLVKISVNDFIGEDGNVFFDIEDGVMRLSDGTTPGGIPLSSAGAEGGASTFRQLLDTPSSFSGAASRFVKVNPQASALEFVDVSLFDGDYNSLSNLPVLNTFDPSAVTQSIIPDTNIAYDLGTATNRWRDIYLSGNTIHLGDVMIRNIDGAVDLPPNSKVHGRRIAQDVSDLTDTTNLLSGGGVTSYNDLTDLPTIPIDISDLADSTNLLAGAGGSGSYTLPIAANNTLGGIKIGAGLSINGSGVVSVIAVGVTSYNDLTDTPTIPADVSELTDTTNLLVHFSGAYADLTGLPVLVTSYNDLTDTPTLFDGAYSSLSGLPTLITSYNDLTDTPTLFDGAYSSLTGLPVLVTSYNDLTDTPTLFSGAYADLTSKPNLSVYQLTINAFSGAYADLTGLPTLFDGAYSSLSGLPTLFSGSYVDLTNKPTIPVDISELTDTSGILSAATFDGSFTSLTSVPTTLAGYGVEVEVSIAISAAVNNVLDGAPALLDTLNEIAAAVGDDPNFVTTINTAVALKANTSDLSVVATSNNYEDLTNLPVIPADVAELSDALKSIVPNAEAEIFAMAVMMG